VGISNRRESQIQAGYKIMGGILLLFVALVLAVSLASYDPGDIYIFQHPANMPALNQVGVFGAWVGMIFFMLFGVSAYMFPMWLVGVVLLLWLRREGRLLYAVLGAFVLLSCIFGLIDLHGGFSAAFAEKRNITDPGGLVSWLVLHGTLKRWMNVAGAAFLLWLLLIPSLVLVVGVANLGRALLGARALLAYAIAHAAGHVGSVVVKEEDLSREERDLRKQRRKLERQMKRQQIADEVRARMGATGEPVASDEVKVVRSSRPTRKVDPAVSVTPRPQVPVTDEPEPADEPLDDFDDIFSSPVGRSPATAPVIGKADRPTAGAPEPTRSSPGAAEPSVEVVDIGDAAEPSPFAGYVLPDMYVLDPLPSGHGDGQDVDTSQTAELLTRTLAHFGVDARVTNVEVGPTVTLYEVLPAPGVRVERIARLSNDMALALKATSVRVQAPIPGKGVVGVEIPNEAGTVVYLREILESRNWSSGKAKVPLALGKDVMGRELVADLAKMPHLLIAGATGSGKSVCMNSILGGLLMSRTPDELKLILVDPKIVEFSVYNDLPHLVVPVITDPKKVSLSLRWAVSEMERRYKMFAKVGARNIEGFNGRQVAHQQDLFGEGATPPPKKASADVPDKVPYVVIIIDELADLMLAAGAEIENSIARLAQLSRAVGIHMIIATQRPSVNVITGTIKANFPARIGFQVAQKVDSRTILDQPGADKLLGRGDMLFLPPSSSKLVRAQGCMVTDEEVGRIVEHCKEQAAPSFEMEIKNKLEKSDAVGAVDDGGEDDALLAQSVEIIRETQRASTSSLQRRLRIGYTRAARIMDILEERGIIGPARGSEPREILIDLDAGVPDSVGVDEDDDAESGIVDMDAETGDK
jgi:S-DNA-T family DNA segregation ATPase FtsK/SpoIIIE